MLLDRTELIPALRARWRFAVLVWMAVSLLVVAVTLVLPPRYEATATLVVDMNAADPVRGQQLYKPAGSVSTYLATQVDLIKSEAVARGALRSLGLQEQKAWRDAWQADTGGRGDFEAWLAAKLLRKLAVVPQRDSNAVMLSYTSDDPEFSAAMTNAFVKSYIDTTLQMRAKPARQFNAFFEERASALRTRLEEAKARLSAYERQNGLIVSDARESNEPDVETTKLAELTAQLVSLQDEAAASSNRQRQAMAGPGGMSEVRNDPEVIELTSQLAREEAQLTRLKTQFGDQYPDVVQAHRTIADLRARLSGATKRAASTFAVPVKANEARLTEVRKAIERQRTLVMKRRTQRNAAAGLLREVESSQKAYDAVLQRASETSLEAANTTQPDVSVVKAATAPPLAASFLLIDVLVVMVLGPLLGIASAMLREIRDRRLRTIHDVTQLLQQPLLLTLPDGHARHRETARRSLEAQRRLVSASPRLAAPR